MSNLFKNTHILLKNDEKDVSFKISSSDNSLGSVRSFESLDDFMDFFNDFTAERINLINIPLQIGTHRLSSLLSVKNFHIVTTVVIWLKKSSKVVCYTWSYIYEIF